MRIRTPWSPWSLWCARTPDIWKWIQSDRWRSRGIPMTHSAHSTRSIVFVCACECATLLTKYNNLNEAWLFRMEIRPIPIPTCQPPYVVAAVRLESTWAVSSSPWTFGYWINYTRTRQHIPRNNSAFAKHRADAMCVYVSVLVITCAMRSTRWWWTSLAGARTHRPGYMRAKMCTIWLSTTGIIHSPFIYCIYGTIVVCARLCASV